MKLRHEPRELGDYYEEEGGWCFWLTAIGVTLLVIVAITAIVWNPPVEEIGNAIFLNGDMNEDGVRDLTDLSILAEVIRNK